MNDENTTPVNSDPTQGPDKDFLELVIKSIVDKPESVKIDRSVDDLGVLIKLTVDESDMSKVVGKSGQTAKALRTLLRLVGSKFNLKVNLKILEPDGSERRKEEPETKEEAVPAPTPKAEEQTETATESSAEDKAPAAETEDKEAGEAFDNVI